MARKLQKEAHELSELFSGSALSHRFTKASYADGTVEMGFDDLKKVQAGVRTWHTHRSCIDGTFLKTAFPILVHAVLMSRSASCGRACRSFCTLL